MSLILNRRRKNVQIAVVVKIRENSRASVGNRINSRNAGNISKFFPAEIQIKRVALVAAEGKSLTEHQFVLVFAKRAFFFLSVIRLRHDLTPKLASGVLH